MSISVCRSKVHYDTEWEATLAAIRVEDRYNEEMEPYQCGEHWHITHKDARLRRGAGHKYVRCEDCREIVKRDKITKHKCKRQT